MEPKLDQKLPKSNPDGAQGRQKSWQGIGRGLAGVWQGIGRGSDPAKPLPKSVKTTIKSGKNTDPTKKRVAFHKAPPLGVEKVANMAPTWAPKWSQDG